MSNDIFPGRLEVLHDPVADLLDDLAALGQHWTRNRERGRMPGAIRQAMLMVARDALGLAGDDPRHSEVGLCATCGCYHKPHDNPLCTA